MPLDLSLVDAGVVALIVPLVQLVRGFGLKSEYASFVAMIFGIGYFVLDAGFQTVDVVLGIVAGLAASGLYDIGGKSVMSTMSKPAK